MDYWLLSALVVLIVALNLSAWYSDRKSGDWHRAGLGNKMRRFKDGKWQYREMSQSENTERVNDSVW